MPDASLSEAIKEAYASAPVDDVIYATLEIYHPAFSVPIRVVQDNANLDAKLEASAPRDAGTVVTFLAFAFDVIPPDQQSESLPQCQITIDNVSQEIITQIEAANGSPDTTTVILRQYLSGNALDGPENDPPLLLTLISINATPTRITATAGFENLVDLKFPKREYELETFPGLAV